MNTKQLTVSDWVKLYRESVERRDLVLAKLIENKIMAYFKGESK